MTNTRHGRRRLSLVVASAIAFALAASSLVAVGSRAADSLGGTPPAKWLKRLPTGLLVRIAPLEQVDLYRGSALDRELYRRVSLNKDGTANITESQAGVLVSRYLAVHPEAITENLWTRPVVASGGPVFVLGTAPSLIEHCNLLFRRDVDFGLLQLQIRRQGPQTPGEAVWRTVHSSTLRPIADLGPLRTGERAMPLDVRFLSGEKVVWRGTSMLDVRVAEGPAELMAPASSPELDAACLAWLDPRYFAGAPPRFPEPALTVRQYGRVEALGTDIAIGVRFEIVQDGGVIAIGSYAAPSNQFVGMCGVPAAVVMVEPNWTGTARPDPAKRPRLRILGDPALAAACFSRSHDGTARGAVVWPSRYWSPIIDQELRFTGDRGLWR